MKAKHLTVAERPRLAAITKHPKVGFAEYERELRSMQFTVQAIQQAYLGTRERAGVVLEGWDAAGKGGIVRRLGWAMDPRSFKVYPIAAPLSHEEGKHYLQRFWEKLPDPGQIVVFDRSWYGRVLARRADMSTCPPKTSAAPDDESSTSGDARETALELPDDQIHRRYEPVRDWGHDLFFFPQLSFDPTRGLVAGARALLTRFSFGKEPFAEEMNFAAAWSTGTNHPRLEYNADVRTGTPVQVLLYAAYSGMDFANFFGLGNETPLAAATLAPRAARAQTPKRGGILNAMLAEDPPGFSVHEFSTISGVIGSM